MRISTFGYVGKQGVKNIWRNKMFSLASIATMSACIFLFGLFFSIIVNFQHIIKTAEEGVAITVFFEEDATDSEKKAIGKALEARKDVAEVKYISAEEAWEEFQKQYFADNPELAEGFKNDNPLASSDNYEVYMKTAEDSKSLTARSRSLSETQKELVSYAQKLDGVREVNKSDVVAKMLSSVNTLVAVISIAIIIILLGVSIFLIFFIIFKTVDRFSSRKIRFLRKFPIIERSIHDSLTILSVRDHINECSPSSIFIPASFKLICRCCSAPQKLFFHTQQSFPIE